MLSKKGVEWSCKPNSVLAETSEDHSSAARVTAAVKQPTRKLERERAVPSLPYLVLLRRGFAMPHPLTRGAVRSYRTISPLPPRDCRRAIGGMFSVALSVASPRLAVSQPAARRSSDFPPPRPLQDRTAILRSTPHHCSLTALRSGKFIAVNCCILRVLERMSARRHQKGVRFFGSEKYSSHSSGVSSFALRSRLASSIIRRKSEASTICTPLPLTRAASA